MGSIKTIFLSTYPPRACGIATFTQDLVNELRAAGGITLGIAAISDAEYAYPPEVNYTLEQQERRCYTETAEKINGSGADLVMIEHEFGIFGGEWGRYVLDFANALKLPFLVTLHTVLPEPSAQQREIVSALAQKCEKIVTMAENTIEILKSIYLVDPSKIAVIPHGVPERPDVPRDTLKKEENLEGRFIVSTFGLLGPGKGLEYGIEAIARAARRHPSVLYLILGQTHPVIKRNEGEKYREKLEEMVKRLRIEQNVRFVNRYLTKDEIIRYLQLSDLYMTPYLGKEQAVSGTLAYAVGYGRVIVSTPYIYAREMLADGRGLLADFRSAESLAERIGEMMENPEKKAEMEQKTRAFGRDMMWSRVAEKYRGLFSEAVESGRKERNE